MLDSAANKDLQEDAEQPAAAEPTPQVVVGAQVGEDTEYHFAGSGEFYPAAIRAKSIEAATEVWLAKRVRIHPD